MNVSPKALTAAAVFCLLQTLTENAKPSTYELVQCLRYLLYISQSE